MLKMKCYWEINPTACYLRSSKHGNVLESIFLVRDEWINLGGDRSKNYEDLIKIINEMHGIKECKKKKNTNETSLKKFLDDNNIYYEPVEVYEEYEEYPESEEYSTEVTEVTKSNDVDWIKMPYPSIMSDN